MIGTARISSKRQVTIPVKIFNLLKLSQGDELVMEVMDNRVVVQKAQAVLDEASGSLSLPRKYKGLQLDEVIAQAKQEHFTSKR